MAESDTETQLRRLADEMNDLTRLASQLPSAERLRLLNDARRLTAAMAVELDRLFRDRVVAIEAAIDERRLPEELAEFDGTFDEADEADGDR